MYLLQSESLDWYTQLINKENTPGIVLVFIVVLQALIIIIKLLYPIIEKKFLLKFTKGETKVSEKKPTKNILEKIDRKLEFIENDIAKANKDFKELSSNLEQHTRMLKNTVKKTYENTFYNEKLTPHKRLRAYKYYIGLKGNGNCTEEAKPLILKNPKVWREILNEDDEFEIIDKKYYEDVLLEIKQYALL